MYTIFLMVIVLADFAKGFKNEKINGNIHECCYVLFVCRLQQ